ncbi:hypothetical protein [Leifsonia soli]|uniref:FtsX-like permease family protein n=1 Tax=Leifsonia soli TaxID=582665 RepID=A0A852SYX6_9MICO|nr:hypothetical protein [Leifsonia soli]NYD74077.1 hypothetical protein [Leifsonia soli]
MRIRIALTEAALNVASGTTRVALYAIIAAAVVTVLAGADVLTVGRIGDDAARYRESGGSTLIYRMAGAIDGEACDSLTELAGVNASGAIRHAGSDLAPAALPAQRIPAFEISPGFSRFTSLGDPRPGQGVLISEDVAHTLGISAGSHLALRNGNARVGGLFAYPSDGRLPGYGYSVLAPADTRAAFDECWVEAWPAGGDVVSTLPVVLLPGAQGGTGEESGPAAVGPQLLQLNASHGTQFDGGSLFDQRLTRFAPAVAAVVILGLGFAATTRRRLELAAARHAGVLPGAQLLQQAAECVAWAVGGCILALPGLTGLILAQTATDPTSLSGLAGKTLAVVTPAAILGTLAATLCVRERHLFRYFKAR